MKKLILLLVLLPLLGLVSCVKQKDCGCGLTGKFVYYETPQENLDCGGTAKFNAIFIPDNLELGTCRIFSDIPKKFQTKDTLNVSVCFNINPDSLTDTYLLDCREYKLKCIEKLD